MNSETLLLYAVVSFLYIISPGPAILLAIYNGLSCGVKSVMISALGNIIGLLFLSLISILGLGAILTTSANLFLFVKIVGAVYLIYIGVSQFKKKRAVLKTTKHWTNFETRSKISYFKEGLLLAITNPKPILFFGALFPQFINVNTSITIQFFVLTFIFMLFSFVSLTCYGLLAKSAKGFVGKEKNVQWFHRITGGLFVSMGVGLLSLKSTAAR